MQQTVSNHRTWLSEPVKMSTHPSSISEENPLERIRASNKFEGIKDMVSENAIIVFGRSGCCMSHVVKRLLLVLGVNPSVYEVIDEKDEISLIHELGSLISLNEDDDEDRRGIIRRPLINQFPCVCIGGKLFGGLDQLMAAHISGDLIPILKKAGALWL